MALLNGRIRCWSTPFNSMNQPPRTIGIPSFRLHSLPVASALVRSQENLFSFCSMAASLAFQSILSFSLLVKFLPPLPSTELVSFSISRKHTSWPRRIYNGHKRKWKNTTTAPLLLFLTTSAKSVGLTRLRTDEDFPRNSATTGTDRTLLLPKPHQSTMVSAPQIKPHFYHCACVSS